VSIFPTSMVGYISSQAGAIIVSLLQSLLSWVSIPQSSFRIIIRDYSDKIWYTAGKSDSSSTSTMLNTDRRIDQ